MIIGTKYANNKVYRGIKHENHLPLTSEDIHEFTDTLYSKSAVFSNNLIGQGTINSPTCSVTADGIKLGSPVALLVDGDIALIQADDEIITLEEIDDAGISDGLVCIVGWYQAISATSTLRAYGGVRNSTLTNDLIDTNLNIQVSTRYQFRWDVVIVDKSDYEAGSVQITLPKRSATGAKTTGTETLTVSASDNSIRVITKPTSMTYAETDLYLTPILSYTYTSDTVSAVESIQSCVIASTAYLNRYRNTVTLTSETSTASDIQVNIGITEYESGDILEVLYNDIMLTPETHYTILSTDKIKLLDFTSEAGDTVTFLVTKLS